ncbi:methyl-accepting chemotaxis protein [[Clostridium] colinum]|uniref:methyl-accepting chemotaxis protein n=1 Tax=[Clostridium] colinum TaxID=36835 RepID=UPI0020252749|nr:methyl-accepting chemotaxis protein [[Clostridium] colinum]
MNKLKNLKLKFKFLIAFGIILLLVFILGLNGVSSLSYANNTYYDALKSNDTTVREGMIITENIANMRRDLTAIAFSNYITEENKKSVDESYKNAKEAAELYLKDVKIIQEKGKNREANIKLVEGFLVSLENYYSLYKDLASAIETKNDTKRLQTVNEMAKLSKDFTAIAYDILEDSFDLLLGEMTAVRSSVIKRNIILIVLFIIIVIVGTIFGTYLSRLIRFPIERLKEVAVQVSKGNLDVDARSNSTDEIGELSNAISNMAETFRGILLDINELSTQLDKGNINYRINTEKYEGVFKDATIAVNESTNNLIEDSLYIVSMIKEFGDGNFESKVKDFPGDKAIIKEEISGVQKALESVSNDIYNLIKAAGDGDLEFRLDTSRYVGQWKEITYGLNQLVENVVTPIQEAKDALGQFSKGNFTHRMTNDYKGEFESIKQNVNYTAESVGSYISEISYILNEMADKNFDLSIEREYLGDFGQIKNSVNLIINNLNNLTKDIISSAEQVSAGAKQISESSISLAEGATKQAEAVEELNSTVKVISNQASDNAKNSEKANRLALQAKESANDGSHQMDSMLVAMEEINNASNSISNIIKVIDDIAFQTNILALNAAVEAARAGEHGKGFAVVAEEVRNLAARSQQAARETTELIESSVEKVAEGSKIANNTAQSLLSIVSQIEEISALVDASTIASKEQEKSIEEVTTGISQIATVTQTNTATSEESAAAAQELASQAEVFYSSVSDFKLKNNI